MGKILSKIQQNSFTLVGLRILVLNCKVANTLINGSEDQVNGFFLILIFETRNEITFTKNMIF